MKFIILSQYFPPETGAPQNRLLDLAVRLKNRGHEVIVLTAKPNYPTGIVHEKFRKGFVTKSFQSGIPVIHCLIYSTRENALFYRLINYLSFVVSSMIIGGFMLPEADFLICESPPLFLSFSGFVLSRIKKAKMILNVSDIYPETAVSLGILRSNKLIKLFYYFESWVYSVSKMITVQTKGIKTSICKRFPNKKVHLFYNGINPNLSEFKENRITSYRKSNGKFIIGYAGIVGYAQAFDPIINSAILLKKNKLIQFNIYGDGPKKEFLKKEIIRLKLTNIKILGNKPHHEILRHMQGWNLGLVTLEDKPVFSGAIPSKMSEIMGMGIPVLLIAPRGEAADIIISAKAGRWIQNQSVDQILQFIKTCMRNRHVCALMGSNGRNLVLQRFNRIKIADHFLSVIEKL